MLRLKTIQTSLESRLKPIQKNAEVVAETLLDVIGKVQRKQSKLVGPKQVFLPRSGVVMKYCERRAISMKDTAFDSYKTQKRPVRTRYPPPTLLLCQGVGTSASEYCSLFKDMNIPSHVRVLVPDHIGLGEELKRAGRDPTPEDILESTSEFLDIVLRDGSSCNALGASLGGGLLYFLRAKRPDLIQKTVLVAPTIPSVLATPFAGGLAERSNPFLEFGCSEDVPAIFRNYLWTDPKKRQEKDPMPIFLFEAMYQTMLRDVFKGHQVQDKVSKDVPSEKHEDGHGESAANETNNIFATTTDLDTDCNRLLIWPEEDQISDLEKGRQFFEPSVQAGNTRIETIPECGHLFDTNLKLVYERIAPKVEEFLLDFSDDDE